MYSSAARCRCRGRSRRNLSTSASVGTDPRLRDRPGSSAVQTTLSNPVREAQSPIMSASGWPEFCLDVQNAISRLMSLETLSRSASSFIALFKFRTARSAQRVRTRSGILVMTSVMRLPDDCRANSIGSNGPSQNQVLRIGKDPLFQTSDPQPIQVICMVVLPVVTSSFHMQTDERPVVCDRAELYSETLPEIGNRRFLERIVSEAIVPDLGHCCGTEAHAPRLDICS